MRTFDARNTAAEITPLVGTAVGAKFYFDDSWKWTEVDTRVQLHTANQVKALERDLEKEERVGRTAADSEAE